ncbi:MAG: sensor histidine kinase [archaeon]
MTNNTIISSIDIIEKIIYNSYLPTIVFDDNFIIYSMSKHFSKNNNNNNFDDNILNELNINNYWKEKIQTIVRNKQKLRIPVKYKDNGKGINYYLYINPLAINKHETYFIIQFEDVEVLSNIDIDFDSVVHKLKQSNKELEQFAYIASHDLQEPLRTISSYCQLIEDEYIDKLDNKGKQYIKYIVSSTHRMKNLINELLDFSRVGKKYTEEESINLNEIIEELKSDFGYCIKKYNVTINYEKMPIIKGSKYRIKQLFQNLISNSIKFRKDNNLIINIGYSEYANYWEFYIKDNGIGIHPEYYDKIFGLFKRLYTKEEYPGTGIGLAICKKIIENHKGKIWVESEPNKGTTFYFTIFKI